MVLTTCALAHTLQAPGRRRPAPPCSRLRVQSQEPLAGNVVYLQPNTVWILEQQRVIAGRPGAIFGRVNDPGAHLLQEGKRRVHVRALARPEAHMVESNAGLNEPLAPVFLIRP